MAGRRVENPRSTSRSHNFELFEFVKILSLDNDDASNHRGPQKPIPAYIRIVREAGYQDHSLIAIVTSNCMFHLNFSKEN